MKTKRFWIPCLLTAMALGVGASAHAADQARWFIGANTGYSWLKQDALDPVGRRFARIEASLRPSVSLEGGYDFGRYFAVSAALHDFGSHHNVKYNLYPGWLSMAGPFKLTARGASVTAMPTFPINEKLKLYAKVGVLFWSTKHTWGGYLTDWSAPDQKYSGHDLLLGVGAEYSFAKRWSARVEFAQAKVRIGTLQGGIYWHF